MKLRTADYGSPVANNTALFIIFQQVNKYWYGISQ